MIRSLRRCLACNALESIGDEEPISPLGWTCTSCGESVHQQDGIPLLAPALADTTTGFDPDAFDLLSKVEDDHFWFVARNVLIVGLAKKFFPDATSFFEIGCGNGSVLNGLARQRRWDRLVGSELHPTGLSFARKRLPPEVELIQMDARNIPIIGTFDLVGAFDVIEHIPEDEAVLRELRTATRPGGGVIVSVPQHPWLWSTADDLAHHVRRYRRNELETKLRRNGFEPIYSSSYTSSLLPLMVASRLLSKKNGAEKRVDREFAISPRVNRLFKAILNFEVQMALAGVRWPAGGSRVVVGRAL